MKRIKTFSITVLIIILSIVGMGFYKSWFGKKEIDVTTIANTQAKKGDFAITVSEVGKLDAKRSVYVSSKTSGKIVKLVPEGSQVKKDEPIVWLDTADLLKQIKDGENALKNAEQDHDKAIETQRLQKYQNDMSVQASRLAVENAKLDYSDATSKLAKTQRLYDAQVVAESSLEDAQLRVLSSKTNVEKAELSLAQMEETQKSNLVSSQIQLAQSKASAEESSRKLIELQDKLKDAVLTSPGDGIIVYELMWRAGDRTKIQEGDQVWERMGVAQIPDLSLMLTKVLIDEIDISKVKVGQDIKVKVDAMPGIELNGKITQIATLAQDKGAGDAPIWMRREASGVKAFEVKAEIDTNQYPLRPGMSTQTDIIIERFSNVVTVPKETVFDVGGKKVVYLLQGQIAREQEVKTGKGDGNYTIIEKGLSGGERICLRNPTKEVKETTSEDKKAKKETIPTKSVPSLPGGK